ncbi:hypothetical protein [Aeromicrobium sp. NPDC092404]|uniref:hypothetical protein n=1 Tax=Aeromicrobium sp. NPDC092404 TaxID=3154976 RepID=UPI0034139373
MRHTTRILAAGAAAATVLLASAGTAMAGSDSIDDKRYDTLVTTKSSYSGGTLASKGTYAQRVDGGKLDVDKMTVNHGSAFISIRLSFHNLDPHAAVVGSVKVNGGTAEDFAFYVEPNGSGGIGGESYDSEDNAGTVCWSGAPTNKLQGTSKLGKGGFIQLYVPRACFDNPKYVKVGASSTYREFVPDLPDTQKSAESNLVAQERFYDPVNSAYFGAPEYTSWLARG